MAYQSNMMNNPQNPNWRGTSPFLGSAPRRSSRIASKYRPVTPAPSPTPAPTPAPMPTPAPGRPPLYAEIPEDRFRRRPGMPAPIGQPGGPVRRPIDRRPGGRPVPPPFSRSITGMPGPGVTGLPSNTQKRQAERELLRSRPWMGAWRGEITDAQARSPEELENMWRRARPEEARAYYAQNPELMNDPLGGRGRERFMNPELFQNMGTRRQALNRMAGSTMMLPRTM